MKIALYTLYDADPRVGEWDDWQDDDTDYVRMSEVVEIDLPLLPDAETAPTRLGFILDLAVNENGGQHD